jgi:hypothetical protein
MLRRFTVLGLPKVLRAMMPNAGIEIYIGLFVMAAAPVIYSQKWIHTMTAAIQT